MNAQCMNTNPAIATLTNFKADIKAITLSNYFKISHSLRYMYHISYIMYHIYILVIYLIGANH